MSSLIILKAVQSDAGVYTCRASNSQESIDASATIHVRGLYFFLRIKDFNILIFCVNFALLFSFIVRI